MGGEEPFVLRFLELGPAFERVVVPYGKSVLVGRELDVQLPDVNLPIPHGTVPTVGPRFRNDADGWTVTDLRSVSGIWINGRSIDRDVPTAIAAGDEIRIGAVRCVVDTFVEAPGALHLRIGTRLWDRHALIADSGFNRVKLHAGSRHSAGGIIFTNEGGRCVPLSAGDPKVRQTPIDVGDFRLVGDVLVFVHADAPPVGERSLSEWRDALRSPNRAERWTAAHMIGALGPEDADSRVALDAAMEDEDAIVRRWAEWAQARAATGSCYLSLDDRRHERVRRIEIPRGGVRELVGYRDACDDLRLEEVNVASDASVRLENTDGNLTITDPSGDYDVRVLGRRIGSDRTAIEMGDHIRIGSAFMLVHHAPPLAIHDDLDVWIESLSDASADTRWTAARVLDRWLARPDAQTNASRRAEEALGAVRDHEDRAVREWAERALACPDDSLHLRLEYHDGRPFSIERLEVRRRQYLTLGRRSPPAHVALGYKPMPSLMAAIGSDCSGYFVEDLKSFSGTMVNRCRTTGRTGIEMGDQIDMGALTFYVHEREPAPFSTDVPHWLAVLEHSPYVDERWTAAQRLEHLDVAPHREDARAALAKALEDPCATVRRWAGHTLGVHGLG